MSLASRKLENRGHSLGFWSERSLFCKDVLQNLKVNLCSHLTHKKSLISLWATFREVFKKVLLFEDSGSEEWSSKLAKGGAGSCSVRCPGQMPWKAACLAHMRSPERLGEVLLMPACIHLSPISSFGFCIVMCLCKLLLVMNLRPENAPLEGSKDSPLTSNPLSSEWEWTHVLLLQSDALWLVRCPRAVNEGVLCLLQLIHLSAHR